MKKQITPKKSTVKGRAKTTKTAKVSKAKVVSKKKVTKRKGLIHHTKRIYHLTPKFVHGALIGAFVGMLVVTWIGSSGNAHADTSANDGRCQITTEQPDKGTQMVDPVGGPKKFTKLDGRAYIKVSVSGKDCVKKVTLAAWKAPDADFKPYREQHLVTHNTKTLRAGTEDATVTMSIAIPDCYFQIDLIHGTNPEGKDGGGAYQDGRMIHSIKGGNKTCPTPEPPPPPVTQHVCEVATGNIVVIPAGPYDTSKYAPENDARCQPKPGFQHVCELSTGKVVEIPAGSYDTNKYGPTTAKECNPTSIVVSSSSTLTKTGPGAILIVLAFATAGGYAFHRTHHHLKTRRQRNAH